MHQKQKIKKIIISLFLACTTSSVFFLSTMQYVYAVGIPFGGFPQATITVADIPSRIDKITSRIKALVGSRAFQQAVRHVTYKLAQDTAIWIASGDQGRKPLIFQKSLSDAVGGLANEIGGQYVVNLTEGWPVDLCSASSVQSQLAITVGITQSYRDFKFGEPTPLERQKKGCSATQIWNNIGEAAKLDNFLVDVQFSFEKDKSDLGQALIIHNNLAQAIQRKQTQEQIDRITGGGYKAVTDALGNILTPASDVKDAMNSVLEKAFKIEPTRTDDIFVDTFFVFLNTLTQTYLKRLERGFYPFRGDGERSVDSEIAGSPASRRSLLAEFSEFSPRQITNVGTSGEIDLFTEMTTCPPGQYKTPYNCVLNEGLQQAVRAELTVRQAVLQGFIDPTLQFPQKHVPDQPVLSVSNLRKLRLLRIIPVGWELGATMLERYGKTVRFQALLDCFDKDPAGGVLIPAVCDVFSLPGEPNNPNDLYRLVDPGWILILPQQLCRATAYTAIPEHEASPNRIQSCVDLQSCIREDGSNNCRGFGYCTRDRAVFNVGTKCEEQYATCQTFRRPDNSELSVLGSTVDIQGCTPFNAGCQWYSKQKFSPTQWDPNIRIYLTSNAPTCRPEDVGAREIIPLEPGVNLIPSDASALPGRQIEIKPHTYYTLSFTATPNGSTNTNVTIQSVDRFGLPGAQVSNVSFTLPAPNASSVTINLQVSDIPISGERYAATFYSDKAFLINLSFTNHTTVTYANIQLEELRVTDGIDALQSSLASPADERNISPSGFVNPSSPATSYTPYSANRRLVFAGALECSADEATARRYTSISGSGEQKVALARARDLCPRQCAGLDEYLSMPTAIELLDDPSLTPALTAFVPSQAQSCPLAQSGCEEFTNLARTGSESERREYYNTVRSCVSERNPNAESFFTWEGTRESGFTLVSWQLLSDGAGGPCASFPQGRFGGGITADNATCTGVNACNPLVDPSCREYLNAGGSSFFRDPTLVVTASNQCAGMRRTVDSGVWYFIPSEANRCEAQFTGCRQFKGESANIVRTALFSDFESSINPNGSWWGGRPVSESVEAGGKSYEAAGGPISTPIPIDAFANPISEALTVKFIAKQENPGATINAIKLVKAHLTDPRIDFDGDGTVGSDDLQKLQLAFGKNGGLTDPFPDPPPADYTGFDLDGNGRVDFNDFIRFGEIVESLPREEEIAMNSAPVILTDEWREYEFGPAVFSALEPDRFYWLVIDTGGDTVYFDNVEVTISPAEYYIDLSTKPQRAGGPQLDSCIPTSFPPVPPEFSRCEGWRDEDNNTLYLTKFDRLFGEAGLSCTAVIDTDNSTNPLSEIFNTNTPDLQDDYVTRADVLMYRYIKPENLLGPESAGCTELGNPDDPATPASWESAYKRIDADLFGASLCNADGEGCTAFTNLAGTTYTFKDPENKLCVWNAENRTFVKNDDPFTACATGRGEWLFTGGGVREYYAAECSPLYDGCTAYLPVNKQLSEGDASIRTVYRDTVSKSTNACTGGEDVELGCVELIENATTTLAAAVTNPDATVLVNQDQLHPQKSRIIEVQQTRECAEWLTPTTISEVDDPAIRGGTRVVQYDLGRCQDIDDEGECIKFVHQGDPDFPQAYDRTAATFSPDEYKKRYAPALPGDPPLTLYSGAWDYTGYSIPYTNNPGSAVTAQYPIELLDDLDDGTLAYAKGGGSVVVNQKICRGYPEESSPFGSTAIAYADTNSDGVLEPQFQGNTRHMQALNTCAPDEEGIGSDACMCSYKKITSLEQGELYYGLTDLVLLPEDVTGITELEGWYGHCVEYDTDIKDPNLDPVCLAWWPVDVIRGTNNVFDNKPEAGFASPQPQYYCLEAKGNRISSPASDFALTPLPEKPSVNNYFIRVDDYKKNFKFAQGVDGKDTYQILFNDNLNTFTTTPNESGMLYFPLRYSGNDATQSPLWGLREYDIEAIVFDVVFTEHDSEWPNERDEFILNRDGFAKSGITFPTTDERWTAFWCGGKGDATCDFGDVYTWDAFAKHINTVPGGESKCDSTKAGTIDPDESTNIFALRARFAEADGSLRSYKFGVSGLDYTPYSGALLNFPAGAFEPYQFVGFEGGWCDNTPQGGFVGMGMTFQLREWCTVPALVSNAAEGNRAWTGRVHNRSVTNYDAGGFLGLTYNAAPPEEYFVHLYAEKLGGVPTPFRQKQDAPAFGALVPPASTIFTPDRWDSRKDFIFEEVLNRERELEEVQTVLEPGKQPIYVEEDKGQVRAGSPYSCRNTTLGCVFPPIPNAPAPFRQTTYNPDAALHLDSIEGAPGSGSPFTYLSQIFAKIYEIWRWDPEYNNDPAHPDAKGYTTIFDMNTPRFDITDPAGVCPILQAAKWNTSTSKYENADIHTTIRGSDCGTGGSFTADTGRYSINGIPVEHNNGDVIAPFPVLSYVGQEVSLEFFGYNENGEQLPLKSISIEWGDDTNTVVTSNFKNHQEGCNDSDPNFGKTSRACEDKPFRFIHKYTKGGNMWPTVRVCDNWDRCTTAKYNQGDGLDPVVFVEGEFLRIPSPGELKAVH